MIEVLRQCDQIGLFLKVLAAKSFHKINPNIGQLFGLFKNNTFLSKTHVSTIWVSFGKIGLIFIPTSGLTVLRKYLLGYQTIKLSISCSAVN